MASVKAFNNVIGSFLGELASLYGDSEPNIRIFADGFPSMAESKPNIALDMFTATYGPHSALINAKDEVLFEIEPMLLGQINVRDLWRTTSPENKEAIWKYLQTLSLLGTTIKMIPQSMLSTIENVAVDCAKQFESGQIDPAALMSAIPKLLGGLNLDNMKLP